jgi:hypothetical protein|tara:strand:+ start:276 stop:890 length:615 start_codon:yes stop_codon:yes gene_type:complete
MSSYKKGTKLPNGYVLGKGRTPLNFTEAQLRYAMKNSKSCSGAARFLNVSLTTYQKYAKLYVDESSGKTLWDLHKNQKGEGVKKPYNVDKGRYALQDILSGKYPSYSVHFLKKRIVNNADKMEEFPHECHQCGYNEKRLTDNVIPLILDHQDDDWTNHRIENLRFLCYNCFHNLRGNLRGRQPEWRAEQIRKAKKKQQKQNKEK